MLGVQLKQLAEEEEMTQIPFQKLHPVHQVESGTSEVKKVQQVGQLWRPQVGLH